jgi:hypothetical protein
MSMSTDIISTRRAISASRLRSNHPGAFEENSTGKYLIDLLKIRFVIVIFRASTVCE